MEITHTPVLLAKVVEYLNCQPNGIYLDATLGSGGHAFTILNDNPELTEQLKTKIIDAVQSQK